MDNNRILEIPDIQLDDGGTYTCHVARNTGSQARRDHHLTVEGINQYVFTPYTGHSQTFCFRLAPVLQKFFHQELYHILVASLTLMALFYNRAIRVRLGTRI